MTRERMTGGGGDEPFVRRWSRRKHAAREGEDQAPAEAPDTARAEPPAEDSATPAAETPDGGSTAAHDDDLPTDADMPPLESLDADSDYSGFLSPRVSETLRRMALRKLFGLSAFNVRDGLDDYDLDYTKFDPLGATVTADMKHHAERRRARQAELDADAEGDAAGAPASGDEEEEVDVAAADTGSDTGAPPEDRGDGDDEAPDGSAEAARGADEDSADGDRDGDR